MLTGLVVVGPVALAEGRPAALDGQALGWLGDRGRRQRRRPPARLRGAAARQGRRRRADLLVRGRGRGADRGRGRRAARRRDRGRAGGDRGRRDRPRRAAAAGGGRRSAATPGRLSLALGAASAFGASLYATGRASLDLPIAWAVLPPRLLGVAFVTLPLVVAGRLRLTRAAAPYVVGVGPGRGRRLRLLRDRRPARDRGHGGPGLPVRRPLGVRRRDPLPRAARTGRRRRRDRHRRRRRGGQRAQRA